jgi:GNAT superfamily N-acetyltransferase
MPYTGAAESPQLESSSSRARPEGAYKEIKTEADIDILLALINEIWPEVFIPIIGKDQVDYMLVHYQGREAIESDIMRAVRYFFIEAEGVPVGYFAYLLEQDRLAISKIYLKKEHRGRGLSSGVFAFFEEVALRNGKEKLFLRVNRNNKQAADIYLHKGFKITDSVDQPLGDRFFLNDFLMEKEIKKFDNSPSFTV